MKISHKAVSAQSYIPAEKRRILETPPDVVLVASSLRSDHLAHLLHSIWNALLVGVNDNTTTNNGRVAPAPVRSMAPDLYNAVQKQQPKNRSAESPNTPRLSQATTLESYLQVLEHLLFQERQKLLELFERYTHFDQTIRLINGGDGGARWKVPGVKDARPAPQLGDFVLVRLLRRPVVAMRAMQDQQQQQQYVRQQQQQQQHQTQMIEIHCQILQIDNDGTLHLSWLPSAEWQHFCANLGRIPPPPKHQKYAAVRIVPNPKLLIRCLTALDWVKQYTVSSTTPFAAVAKNGIATTAAATSAAATTAAATTAAAATATTSTSSSVSSSNNGKELPPLETDPFGPSVQASINSNITDNEHVNDGDARNIWQQLLFPTLAPLVRLTPATARLPQLLVPQLNAQQQKFVQLVLHRTLVPAYDTVRPPLLLTGPAGTGKTKTLLSAVQRVLDLNDDAPAKEALSFNRNRVLLCTPSHTAANVLTQRLAQQMAPRRRSSPTEASRLFRLLDPDRPVSTIPIDILPFCCQHAHTGAFAFPDAYHMLKFDIVVCTCSDAHLLYRMGLANPQLATRRRRWQAHWERATAPLNLRVSVEGAEVPHFTHLFVDEAAQATEAETLIPLSIVVDPVTVADGKQSRKVEIILVGDPKQLCPDVHCAEAAEIGGLDVPCLERLLRRPVSCLGGGAPTLLGPDEGAGVGGGWDHQLSIFLTENYRGHPSFLMLSSSLFYSDRLFHSPQNAPMANHWNGVCRLLDPLGEPFLLPQSIRMLYSDLLLGNSNFCGNASNSKSWPIRFIGVQGKDTSASVTTNFSDGESWSNAAEAEMVAQILTIIVKQGRVATSSIGVMSPFRAQALEIRKRLRARQLGAIDVGTVSDYQAKEQDTIVLSMTRSTPELVANDIRRRVGLFGAEQRANVAMTRAENLFVVVGNPDVLMKDFAWRQFLLFCLRNGLWYGTGSEAAIHRYKTDRIVKFSDRRAAPAAAVASASASLSHKDSIRGDENVIVVGSLERSWLDET